jgi:hypothetical protein
MHTHNTPQGTLSTRSGVGRSSRASKSMLQSVGLGAILASSTPGRPHPPQTMCSRAGCWPRPSSISTCYSGACACLCVCTALGWVGGWGGGGGYVGSGACVGAVASFFSPRAKSRPRATLFLLTCSPPSLLPLDQWVLTTEAHPLRIGGGKATACAAAVDPPPAA